MVINNSARIQATDSNGDFIIDKTDREAYSNIIKQLADTTNTKLDAVRDKLRTSNGVIDIEDLFDENGKALIDFDNDGFKDSTKDRESLLRLAGSDGKLSSGDFIEKIKEDGNNDSDIEKLFYNSLATAFRSGGTSLAPFLQDPVALENTLVQIDNAQKNSTFSVGRGPYNNNDLKENEEYLLLQNLERVEGYDGGTQYAVQLTGTTRWTNTGNTGMVFNEADLTFFGNTASFNALEGTITINGKTVDLKKIPHNNQAALEEAFAPIFADIVPKPQISFSNNGGHYAQAWFNISFTSPDSKHKMDISMNTVGSHHDSYKGITFSYTAPNDVEGRGIALDPLTNKQAYSIKENSGLIGIDGLITDDEMSEESINAILDSGEYAEYDSQVSEAMVNGSESDLLTLLNEASMFGVAGSTIRSRIIAEMMKRDIESFALNGNNSTNASAISLNDPKFAQLKNTYPKEFTQAVVSLATDIADKQIEIYKDLKQRNDLNALVNGATGNIDNNTLDQLINSWENFANYGDLVQNVVNLDSDFFDPNSSTFDPQNSAMLESLLLDALNAQAEISENIIGKKTVSSNGRSDSELRTILNTNLLTAITLGNNQDLNEAIDVRNQIQNGTSVHGYLLNHENTHQNTLSASSNQISGIEAQIAALDPNSSDYSETLSQLQVELNKLKAIQSFATANIERDNQLKIGLAVQLDLFTGRNQNKLTDLLTYIELRNMLVGQINAAILGDASSQRIKELTDGLNNANKAINDLVRSAGGTIRTSTETNALRQSSSSASRVVDRGTSSSSTNTSTNSDQTLAERTQSARDDVVRRYGNQRTSRAGIDRATRVSNNQTRRRVDRD